MQSDTLKQIMQQAAECGFPDVRLRDAAFAILDHTIADPRTTYTLLFPSENPDNAADYVRSPLAKTLARRVRALMQPKQPKDTPREKTKTSPQNDDDISFDQNKAAMLAMLKEIDEQKKLPDADIPKLLKIEADIRVKLNDKFEVTTAAEQQYIHVQPKFNHICEHTRRECWLQTKEYAMQHWGLVDPDDR